MSGHNIILNDTAEVVQSEPPTAAAQPAVASSERDQDADAIADLAGLVVVLDRQGRIVRFNSACEQLTGYSAQEVTGRHIADLLADVEEVGASFLAELCAGRVPSEYMNHWLTKDGRRRLIMWSNTILTDQRGGIEYVICAGIDVTLQEQTQQALLIAQEELQQRIEEGNAELVQADRRLRDEANHRRLAEAALLDSYRDWESTFDAAQEAICVIDTNQTIVRCNQAMLTLLGKSRESVVGRTCCEAVDGNSQPGQDALLDRLQSEPCRGRAVVKLDDRWLRVMTDPLLNETGEVTRIVYIISDITGQRRAEEAEAELKSQRILSLRADRLRSLGEMAAGIAHELNQPLVGVRGLAEHLLIGIDKGWNLSPQKLQRKLTSIIEQADRMSHIIERVRMFARDAGKPETRPVRINDVAHGALDMLGPQLRPRGIKLQLDLAESLPLVIGNPMSLEEVVLNLVSNAADALTETGSIVPAIAPPILVRTRAVREADEVRVQLQVIDQGTGISDELLGKVFEPFLTTKGPDHGTGLGLAICKQIVEQVGGKICLESAVGRGTTVTVTLPAYLASDAEGES